MMFINVVTVQSGWILQKIAERIVKAGNEQELFFRDRSSGTIKDSVKFRLSHIPRTDCIANFYVDIQNCYSGKTSALDIGMFTHLHENDIKHIKQHWLSLDYIIHMCKRYKNTFKDFYREDRMSVMYPCEVPDKFYLKKPTIGIFQRGKYEGKGFNFMLDMVEKHSNILDYFKWHFVGDDWEKVRYKMETLGIEVSSVPDTNLKYPEGYSAEYDKVDYVLIPSLWEGGPMSVIEANAKGIPIIAANVGWCGDIEVDYIFEPNDTEELNGILHEMVLEKALRYSRVGHLSYKYYSYELTRIVAELLGEELR